MTTAGEILKAYGTYRDLRAVIKVDKNLQYTLFISGKTIAINDNLGRVDFESKSSISTGKVLIKSTLGAAAANQWKQDYGGTAGFLTGVASSIDVNKETHLVHLRFISGETVSGNANERTINLLQRLSLGLSLGEIDLYKQQQDANAISQAMEAEKYQRFLDDAPRTIKEVESNLRKLNEDIAVHLSLSQSGSTFEEREQAIDEISRLKGELSEAEYLHQALRKRIISVERYGSYSAYEQAKEIAFKAVNNEKRKIGRTKLAVWIALIVTIACIFSDVQMQTGGWTLLFVAWLHAFYCWMTKSKRIAAYEAKLLKFNTEYEFINES